MNKAKKINEKLLFVTEFWMKLQRCDVEAFDVIYPVDATAILEDLKECIVRVISENRFYRRSGTKYLNTNDLSYLIEEYNQYVKHTPFMETDLEPFLKSIKTRFDMNNNFEQFLHDATSASYSDFGLLINDIDHCLNRVRSNLDYFDDIMEVVLGICRNRNSLLQEILRIKGYLTELYIFGIANRYSKEKLEKLFKPIDSDMPPYCNIKNLKYVNQKSEEKEYTLIFEVKNFFIQSPIRWGDMLIYNPMRVDLLVYMENEDFLDEDYYLLDLDKRELFDKYELRGDKILWDEKDYESHILRTNAHIRLKVKTDDIHYKIGQVRNELNDKVRLLSVSHNSTGFPYTLTDKYSYIKDGEVIGHTHHIFDYGLNSVSGFTIRNNAESIESSLDDATSMVNRIDNLTDKKNVMNALRWYDSARFETNENKKFLYYFICIETILSESIQLGTIKNKVLDVLTPMLSSRAFSEELHDYYRYYRNQFTILNRKYKGVPTDVKEIDGFENFMVKIDAKKFRDSLPKLKRYNDSVYYSIGISKYLKMYNSEKFRKKIVSRYERKVRFILARTYRNRNKIVHSGCTNHYQIQVYNTFLGFSASTLLQSIIGGITVRDVTEDIGNKLLNTTISSNYNTWFNDFI